MIACYFYVYVCCQNGETALLLAAKEWNTCLVQLLLNNGANVNDKDNVSVDVLTSLASC